MANALGSIQLPDDTLAKLLATYKAPTVSPGPLASMAATNGLQLQTDDPEPDTSASGSDPLGSVMNYTSNPTVQQPSPTVVNSPVAPLSLQTTAPDAGLVQPTDAVKPDQSSVLGSVSPLSQAHVQANADLNARQALDKPAYDYHAHGFLGNLGHVLGRAANITGDILDPGATSLIPDSDLYNAEAKNYLDRKIQQDTQNEQTEKTEQDRVDSDTANRTERQSEFEAGAPERTARVAEANANTAKAEQDTKDLIANNQPLTDESTAKLNAAWSPAFRALGLTPTFATGQSPVDVQRQVDAVKTLTEIKARQDAQASALADRQEGRREHEEDLAEARAERQDASANKQDAATRKEVLTLYTPTLDAAKRLNVMSEAGEKAKQGDQQAGLAVLTNHLGMTAGGQKGMRITQAMMEEAQQSRPWLQGVKATWSGKGPDAYLTGVVLSPQQVDQMVGLGRTQLRESANEARQGSAYVAPGRTDDGPDRIPSTSTMHMYLKEAGGDVQKAKAAAKEDGWSVK